MKEGINTKFIHWLAIANIRRSCVKSMEVGEMVYEGEDELKETIVEF